MLIDVPEAAGGPQVAPPGIDVLTPYMQANAVCKGSGGGGEEIATCLILPPGKYICKVLFFSFFSPSSAFFSRPPLGVVRQAGRSALTHTSMWQGRCWGTRSRPGIFFLPFFPFSVISMRRVLCTVDQKRRRTQAPHFHNMTVCAAAQERAVGNDKEKKKFSPE